MPKKQKNKKLKKRAKKPVTKKKNKIIKRIVGKKVKTKKVVVKRKSKIRKKRVKKAIRKKAKKIIPLGGMAFANGIMLRTKNNMAIVMADDAGRTELISFKLKNIRDKFGFLFAPFIRGVSFFIENLYFFLKISWHKRPFVKKTLRQKPKLERFFDRINQCFIYLIYILLLIGFFNYLYIRLNIGMPLTGIAALYSFLITFLYLCIFAILFFLVSIARKEELDIFSYHGAEHKIISTYESGGKMDIKNIEKANLLNDRCAMAVFFWAGIVLSLLVTFLKINEAGWFLGFLITVGLVFVSFSISYELTRLVHISRSSVLEFIFIKPLYIFQFILAHNPDEKHLKVGLVAYDEVMRLEKGR